ncbi:hypothetical protein G7085_13015 [Tessaracoccus sp. HDW20]|uniref:hypothetical protein n=1 Tax=Tessaracoccus coleopterorum TaxID=2714950 RepID=UPI0018D3F326|nr:hypothetical protein [Tessaracoccus coleopterorum]NHB85237.1 hypothetical protein [Tessaracoccus coleopterorum]
MAGRTADGFEMTAAPVPTLTTSPTLPPAAIHSTPTEAFLVPASAANPEGERHCCGRCSNPRWRRSSPAPT